MAQTKTTSGKGLKADKRAGLGPRRWRRAFILLLLSGLALGGTFVALRAGAQGGAAAVQGEGQRGARGAAVPPKRPSRRPAASSSKSATARAQAQAADADERERLAAGLETDSPPLASADFDLVGLAVTSAPATQTVPKNTPTAVLTSVNVPAGADPAAVISGLNPNHRVRGELTGPSLSGPLLVEAPVGQPLPIPPLAQAGEHALQNLRVVDVSAAEETVVAPVTPDACGIVVIERLLISEVRVTELSYDQIVQAGINITDDSYQAFNFTLGLGTTSGAQSITIPVAFPGLGARDPRPVMGTPTVRAPGVDLPTVVPVMLTPQVAAGGGQDEESEQPSFGGEPVRVPGVVVFPGRVGFLHQFFEAVVIVANGAPNGAPLVLRGLRAKAKLPDNGTPADASDDPLRIAETQAAGRVSELELRGLGDDGRYGTADDATSFGPGQSGQGTFLLEGLKEGMHTVNFGLEAMLEGLPTGPVKVEGEVPGAVLVRDASFAVTFTHPSVVRAGQEYDLTMTLYNTGGRDIQGAFAQLGQNAVSGAELTGNDSGRRSFATTIKRKDSATVKWRLRSNRTGAVTASYVKVGEGVSAGLALVTGVGDRGVPLSPDSLILPDPVRHLPPGVVEAASALLGQAWGVANAPPGSLPEGVLPLTKQVVIDRAVELGIAGMRADFGEPVTVSLGTLVRDWLGELKPDEGFADALRNTPAGYAFQDSVGAEFGGRLSGVESPPSPAELHRELSNAEAPRSPFVSALLTHAGGQPVAGARLVNAQGQRVGFGPAADERAGDLRAGVSMRLTKADAATGAAAELGQMTLVSNPGGEGWTLEIYGWQDGTVDLSLLYPGTGRNVRHLTLGGLTVARGGKYRLAFRPGNNTITPAPEAFADNAWQPAGAQAVVTDMAQPEPRLVGVIQVTPEVVTGGDKYGRLLGLLFSKPMLRETAESASKYKIGGGELRGSDPAEVVGGPVRVNGARLDYGDRFVFLSLDSTVGPYIRRDLTAAGLSDARRTTLPPATREIEPRVSPGGVPPGAYLTGRVLNADGTPVPDVPVSYWSQECRQGDSTLTAPEPRPVAVRRTDARGLYQFDYVRASDCAPLSVTAHNPSTGAAKSLTSAVAYDGQHMVLDMVFLARGGVRGQVTGAGRPMPRAYVQVVPELDVAATRVVQADEAGRYSVADIPVGNVSVLAVGYGADSSASGLAAGVIAGPGQAATVNVALQNVSGVVRGRVTNPDLSPAPGALVVAYARIPGFPTSRNDGATAVGYDYADREGHFTVGRLPVGDISLEVTDYVSGFSASQRVQLTTAAPEVSGVLILLPGVGSVSGRVFDDTGRPVADAAVNAAGRAVKTDALGNFELQGMPAGTHHISATDPQSGMTGSAPASVRLGEATSGVNVFIMRPSFVQGRVFVVEEGATAPKPLAGAKVTSDGFDIVETDSQGNYRLSNVASNRQVVLRFVDAQRALAANLPVVLSPGETLTRDATLRPGTVRGRVTQPDGVTGTVAEVRVYAPRPSLGRGYDFGLLDTGEPAQTLSAADGTYSVSGLNPGTFRASTSNVFFPTPVSAGGVLTPGGVAACDLSLVSTLAGKIHGRVFRPDGKTPAGAGVRVTLSGGSLAGVTVRTDEQGRYEFAEVFSAGGYALTAADPSSGNANRIHISAEKNKDAVFDLRLLGSGTLRVKVVDGGGAPVSGGRVTLEGAGYPHANRHAEITPDGGGVVEFNQVPEGPYGVSASERGLGGRASVVVPLDTAVETTVRLQASGAVEGRVLMPGGTTPVGLADVELRVGGRSVGFAVTSDAEADAGRFRFLNVPAGDFTLDVLDNRTGRAGRSGGHVGVQGETVTADVELVAVGAVTGRVTSNGQPVDHALVHISADGSGVRGVGLRATTDEEGRYRFAGIPVGRFRVDVSDGPGGQAGSVSGAVIGTAEPLPDTVADVALEPSQSVTGTVRGLGGEATPGAQITIRAGGRDFRTATNEAGVYRLGFLPLGEVRVRAEAPTGFDRGESAPVTGTQPGGTVTADVTLAGTGAVKGRASDSDGAPLALGAVSYTNDAWHPPINVTAPVQADGSFEIKGVPAGPFALRLTAPGRVGVGTASGVVAAGQSADVPLRLEDAGRVTGRVRTEDGASPVTGADVTLTLSRPSGESRFYTHTDSQGAWVFDNLPLGIVSVRATDPASGASARASERPLKANGQVLDLGELRLHAGPYGAVRGVVTLPGGQPAPGASVTLAAAGGILRTTTAADGSYGFEPVDVGDISLEASDSNTGLRGRASARLGHDGQVLNVNLQLLPNGTVTGTVFRHGGAAHAAGAQVTVRAGDFSGGATADAQGRYAVEFVPAGDFIVDAVDPATGDRGRASDRLNSNGQTRSVNVTFVGLGQVVVTVRDAAGNAAAGARVKLTTSPPFASEADAITRDDGAVTFDNVLAGGFTVAATHAQTGLGASAAGSVAAGATAQATLQLQATGTLAGRVLAPDGATPLAGATVKFGRQFDGAGLRVKSGREGDYRFDNLLLGTYTLYAFDDANRVRAAARDLKLAANGEVVTRDLTFAGIGAIAGRVTGPDGAAAPNVPVTLAASNPEIESSTHRAALTDNTGAYSFGDIPAGRFNVVADDEARGLRGEATGHLSLDGETVTADVRLVSNAVSLATVRHDANNFQHDIGRDGANTVGTNLVFGYGEAGGFRLNLVSGGAATPFTGNGIGTAEEGGREVAIRQHNLAGLNVTRKVYVPREGYFARYLELLHNPTAGPVTVSARVLTSLRPCSIYYYCAVQQIIRTSTGDGVLDTSDADNPDRWLVVDDYIEGDPFLAGFAPPTAFAFDGAGARARVVSTGFHSEHYGGGQLTYEWEPVTIQPGETVAYLHFGVQQVSRAAAQASAERLAQLPPEALAGLSQAERERVRNFSVPPDGAATLPPLAALNGSVSGRVLAGDDATGVGGGKVELRSSHPLFGRTYYAYADAAGAFAFAPALNDGGTSVVIPLGPFTLRTRHPQTDLHAPEASGDFAPGQTGATQDIIFTGTGVLRGTVRRHNAAPVTQGQVNVSGPSVNANIPVAADGSYALNAIPAGNFRLKVSVPHPQGNALGGTADASVTAGQTTVADINVQPTGTVEGTIRNADGTPSAGTSVRISYGGHYSFISTRTDPNGRYLLGDAPAGDLNVVATEPKTGFESVARVTLARDQTLTQDFTLNGVGRLSVLVTYAGGGPVANTPVDIREASSAGFRRAGYTDAAGRLDIPNVPTGPFAVISYNPNNTRLKTELAGNLATHGATVPVAMALPASGTVRGRVTLADGRQASGAAVSLVWPSTPGSDPYSMRATADASGNYVFTNVEANHAFAVRAQHPTNPRVKRELFGRMLTADGQTLTLDLTLQPTADLRVTVLKSGGTPNAGAEVYFTDGGGGERHAGATDAVGVLVIPDVSAGNFSVRAYGFVANVGHLFVGSASGVVGDSDQGRTVEVTINPEVAGNVQGTVFLAGQPRPGVRVVLTEAAGGYYIAATSTDMQGTFNFADVRVGAEGFRVTAEAPWNAAVTAGAAGRLNAPGETANVDVTLPAGVVRGRVLRSDGLTPVPYPSVWVTQASADGGVTTYFASRHDYDGSFTVEGLAAGDFTAYAQQPGQTPTGVSFGGLLGVDAPGGVDIVLPPSGKVRGTVRDAANNPVAFVEVRLSSGDSDSEGYAYANGAGVYEYESVGLGSFFVQARHPSQGTFGSAAGTLNGSGDTAVADINFPATTTVSGRILRADGATPVANARVFIENFTGGGSAGRFARMVNADAAGDYALAGVPAGLLRVTAAPPGDDSQVGDAEATLDAAQPAAVNVTLGNVVSVLNLSTLKGADNFQYQFWSGGAMEYGGTPDARLYDAYNGAFNSTLNNNWWYENVVRSEHWWGARLFTAAVEDGGREYVFGHDALMGLLVRRKLYVPAEGGFARYLDIFRNPTDRPVTLTAGLDSSFGENGPAGDTRFRVVVRPGETDNTYAVTAFNDACCHPSLAHVFGGPGARVPPRDAQLWNKNNQESRSRFRWRVTVPAGETVILMHFTAQREPGDTAGARAQAESLAALADPRALEGMSDEEKAQVVNFRIAGPEGGVRAGKVAVRVKDADGTPAANAPVYIRESARGNATRAGGHTDAQGRVTVNDVAAGPFTVRAHHPLNSEVTGEAAGAVGDGEVTEVTVALAGTGTVAGRVTQANGTPLSGASVTLSTAGQPPRTVRTDADGNYAVPVVPVGRAFTVKAARPDSANVTSTSAEQKLDTAGQQLTLDIALPMRAWVSGRVRAGDGQTPVAYARVEVLDALTGQRLDSGTWADGDGMYVTGSFLIGPGGVRVRAAHLYAYVHAAEVTARLAGGAASVGDADLTLPLPVLRGTVMRADNTPVPYPTLFLNQAPPGGSEQSMYVFATDAAGHYTAIGLGLGDFTLGVRDPEGFEVTRAGTFASVSAPLTLDVTMPAGGTVTGTVFDAAGAPLPYASLRLTAAGVNFDRSGSTDEQGKYRIERVAPGRFFVQAEHPQSGATALGFGSVALNEAAAVDITLPGTGTVRGRVVRADGTTPVANARVLVENFEGAGGSGHFYLTAYADASGHFEAPDVQAGVVRLTVPDPSDRSAAGTAQVTLAAGATAQANVTLGNAVAFYDPYFLDGADGFRYDIYNDGDLLDGGTADGRLSSAYWGSHYLTLDDKWWYSNNSDAASLEDGGREIVIGPDSWGGLYMTRKVFVPASGGFARYLETLTNTSDRPLTYRMGLEGWAGFGNDTRLAVAPAENANTYAVLYDHAGTRPALAEVFAGPGAGTPVSATNFPAASNFTYQWDVTVPAGQTVILMHFAVQREPGDTAGARAQAESLAALADPRALEGMSPEERSRVVNFRIPNQAGVKNENPEQKTTQKRAAAEPRGGGRVAAALASLPGDSAAAPGVRAAARLRGNRPERPGLRER